MASPFRYLIRLYDLDGNQTGDVSKAHSRWWNPGPVNGAATLGFTLDVDDPRILLLDNPLGCVVKMWRFVDDPVYGVTRDPVTVSDPTGWIDADFAGRVSARNKAGRIINYTCSDPLWASQFHFHVRKHRLIDPLQVSTGSADNTLYTVPATLSGLMWKIINLVQKAFPATEEADFGLRFDPDVGTGNDPGRLGYFTEDHMWVPGVYHVPRNSWAWDDHIQFFLGQDNGPDIHIRYQHRDGRPRLALWYCDWPGRGTDVTRTVSFGFGVDPHNLDVSMDYDESYVPKQWGNFVRALASGTSDTGLSRQMVLDEIDPTSDLAAAKVGLFMFQEQYNQVVSALLMDAKMRQDLLRQSARPLAFTVKPSNTKPPYYDVDYTLGDVCIFESIDGHDHVGPVAMRIMDARLALSDNDYETVTLTVAIDYLGKVILPNTLQQDAQQVTGQTPDPPSVGLEADFTVAPASGVSPLDVVFTDASIPAASGVILSWDLDFSDGTPHGTGPGPWPHTYNGPANYTPNLVVTGGGTDGTASQSHDVPVTGTAWHVEESDAGTAVGDTIAFHVVAP